MIQSIYFRAIGIRIVLTLLLTPILFYLGKFFVPYSGDGHYVEEMVVMDWVVLMHSPLTTIIHKCFYEVLHPFGFTPWTSTMVSSSMAGAMALQVLFALRANIVFLLINILSGSFLIFVAEVENYAWVNLCLFLTFLGVNQFLQEKRPLWPALSFFFLGCAFHLMLLFYLPPLFWIMKKHSKRFHPLEFLIPFLAFIGAFIALNLLLEREGLFLDSSRLVPWFEIQRKGQFFTLFSHEHLALLAKFHIQGSFLFGWLGFPIEWPLLILLYKRINSQFKYFLLFNTLIGLVWTTFWHPDLGPLDWDLFSHPYLIAHILLGWLLAEWFNEHAWIFTRKNVSS